MNRIIEDIRIELYKNADEKVRISSERFFKEPVKLYGVRTAEIVRIGKEFYNKIKENGKAEIFSQCELLWQSGLLEEAGIACNWSYYARKDYKPDDINTFEKWISKYVNNWATCDTFCNHTVGTLLTMFPEKINYLKKWTGSVNRWMRRASAVSLIVPARKGLFLNDIFEIADLLLLDKDDMVQKGYGWMLKSASQAYQKDVFEYIIKHKDVMPRTSLRYAIEKMPPGLKSVAMAK